MINDGTAGKPGAFDIDLHHPIPLCFIKMLEARAFEPCIERGVIDQYIDPAKGVHGE